jgi:hypothetical protein
MDQRSIIKNPNSVAFQESYVCLGKVSGKDQLRADCQRLQIRVSASALQVIERGYSHKMRASYSNNESAYRGGAVVWGDDKLQTAGNFTKKVVVVVKSEEEVKSEVAAKKLEAEEKRLEEKKKRMDLRKKKKWEKMKKVIAAADSWEDIVI